MWLRIGLGLCGAVTALFVLHRVLRIADARAAARTEPLPASVAAREPRQPPVQLSPCVGRILLASRADAVPADAAPVTQVFADGGHAVLRPATLPSSPAAVTVRAATIAAIVLPGPDLAALAPRARATFAEVVGCLVAERPVPSARFVTQGVAVAIADLDAVLRWVR